MKKVELLAPVKDEECLKAVIESGADSVYMGYQQFNARMFGKNFDESEFRKCINYAHDNNVRVYLTLNTLIREEEMPIALRLAVQAAEDKVDGILVQDLGLAAEIQKKFPQIKLHASTQMSVANHYGVQALYFMGFSRVVMARELNCQEIIAVKQNCCTIPGMVNMGIETFIHGGLCIAYSGQCFSSSYCFGSSANRGKCLMTCWKGYTLVADGKELEHGSLLRPRDLEGLQGLRFLLEGEVDCLKIQGRLRSKEYIREVISIYRQAIEDFSQNQYTKKKERLYDQKLWKISPRGLTGGNLLPELDRNADVEVVIPKESNKVKQKVQGKPVKKEIAIYLKEIILEEDYSLLRDDIKWVYIPYLSFLENRFTEIIRKLCDQYEVYLYMPPMIYERNCEFVYSKVDLILNEYDVKGIVLSNVSDLILLKSYGTKHLKYVSGDHLHICNHFTADKLMQMGIETGTLSQELPYESYSMLKKATKLPIQQIIFGHPDLMHMKYCLLSHSNECIHCGCCKKYRNLELRGEAEFDIRIQEFQTETILYSKRILSLNTDCISADSVRLDFLGETVEEMNYIINDLRYGYYYTGIDYINDILKGDQ